MTDLSVLGQWRQWRSTPVLMRRYLVEATFELLRARLVVAFALRRCLPALLLPQADDSGDEQTVRDVRYIVHIAADAVPWRSLCLHNAIAAKRMLGRRGIGSTLHLGVGFREEHEMHAHAWLEARGLVITGDSGRSTVTQLPTAV